MAYIRGALGDIDVEAAQREVFAFDWHSVPDVAPGKLPGDRSIWPTSFWGLIQPGGAALVVYRTGTLTSYRRPIFAPKHSIAHEAKRNRFLKRSSPNALVALYVIKVKGPVEIRGKVAGVLEVSHNAGMLAVIPVRFGCAAQLRCGKPWRTPTPSTKSRTQAEEAPR